MPFKYSLVRFCVINNFLFRKLWTSYSSGPAWTSRVSPDMFFGIGKSTKMTDDVISDQPRSAKKIPENDHMASWKTPPWTKTMYFPIEIPDFPSPCDRCQFFDTQSPTTQEMTKGWRSYNSQSRSYGKKCRDFIMFSEVTKKQLTSFKKFRQNPTHHFFWKRRGPSLRLHFLEKK